MARVSYGCGDRLGERAVAIVVVEKVVFLKIVGDVQVEATVPVQVARHDAEAVPRRAAAEASVVAHVDKMASVVPVEAVTHPRAAGRGPRERAGRALGVG